MSYPNLQQYQTISNVLTLCDLGGPKNPQLPDLAGQLSKLPNSLNWMFKSGCYVFESFLIDFEKIFNP